MQDIKVKLSIYAGRSRRGSMWGLLICAFFVMTLFMIAAMMVCGVYLAQQHTQYTLDRLTMQAALTLNESDMAGHMNQLVNRSRQLVASNHDTYDEAYEKRLYNLEPLAHYLMNQSHEGAKLVESAQKQFLADRLNVLRAKTDEDFIHASLSPIELPWLTVKGPRLLSLSVGRSNDLDSSIYAAEQLDRVAAFDMSKKRINTETQLYKADQELRLDEDAVDFAFRLSSLDAPHNSDTSQARLISPDSFVKTGDLYSSSKFSMDGCKYVPSAVQVKCEYAVINKLAGNQVQKLIVTSSALTSGAAP